MQKGRTAFVTHRGVAEARSFAERFVAEGIQVEIEDILVNGPPWHTRVAIRAHDHIAGPDGRDTYNNRFVDFIQIRWGRMHRFEVYEDTERVARWDEATANQGGIGPTRCQTGPMRQSPPTAFRGWHMLGWSTLILALTAPGQTIGVSSFIDHMIEDLDIGRSSLSAAYLIATLTGSAALPPIGRWVDRRGVSHATTVVGAAFAVAIALLAGAQGILVLGVGFVGIRMLGQGSLSLIGDTSISLWFQARRGRAFAIAMTVSAGLMALSPLVFTALIDAIGWRQAWLVTAVFIGVTVPTIGRFVMVDRPSAIGQVPDGLPGVTTETFVPQPSLTVREAVRTPAFPSLMSIVALSAALITGLTFHNVSVMGEGGLTETEAAAIFVPQMVGVVSASFVVGWLTDRVRAQVLVPFAGLALAAALVLATSVGPGVAAMLYGLVSGIAGGSIRALGSALLPKWFGTDHIGAIRGISHTVAVAASATGPLMLSIGNDLGDSYQPVLMSVRAAIAAVAGSTALVKDPVAPDPVPEPAA